MKKSKRAAQRITESLLWFVIKSDSRPERSLWVGRFNRKNSEPQKLSPAKRFFLNNWLRLFLIQNWFVSRTDLSNRQREQLGEPGFFYFVCFFK